MKSPYICLDRLGTNVGKILKKGDVFSQRKANVSSPAIFAVRQVGAGRAALLSQFRQFTIGSGSSWLYDDIILNRGLDGLASDQARLLVNTVRKPSFCAILC
eukprot:COSAG06_NODE_304_length_17855_cov_47.399414_11_plen_102_part_00